MTRIIAVANQKGGVGKSTTAANLACAWAQRPAGKRVLAVDMDPQSNLTEMFGVYSDDAPGTIDDLFLDNSKSIADVRAENVAPGVDVVAAGPQLSSIETTLAGKTGKDFMLAGIFEGQVGEYDVVLIDCPPNLGALTGNSLFASNAAIVPINMNDRFSVKGLAQLMETLDIARKHADDFQQFWALKTFVHTQRRNANKALDVQLAEFGVQILQTEVPFMQAFPDAGVEGIPVSVKHRFSKGGWAYIHVAEELDEWMAQGGGSNFTALESRREVA